LNTALDDSAIALVLDALTCPTIAIQTGSTAASPTCQFLRRKTKMTFFRLPYGFGILFKRHSLIFVILWTSAS